MLDLDVDVCAALENMNDAPLIARYALRGFQKTIPGLLHKCPYHHIEGFRNISVDKTANEMLPQMIPKGEYKIMVRGHTRNNQTIFFVTMIFLVDAVDPLKSMEMGKK